MDEIREALENLSDRVREGQGPNLAAFVSLSLRRISEHLQAFIPGLDTPPDAEAARFLGRAAHAALEDGDQREALARALRGLAQSPHHPGLFYLASSACFEFGSVNDAVRLLRHTLWIHPGHRAAQRDLAALHLYLRERCADLEERTAEDEEALLASWPDNGLAFDLAGDDVDDATPGPFDEWAPPAEDEDRAA
jgi:tetratricopeptide (TPR) repeat protein